MIGGVFRFIGFLSIFWFSDFLVFLWFFSLAFLSHEQALPSPMITSVNLEQQMPRVQIWRAEKLILAVQKQAKSLVRGFNGCKTPKYCLYILLRRTHSVCLQHAAHFFHTACKVFDKVRLGAVAELRDFDTARVCSCRDAAVYRYLQDPLASLFILIFILVLIGYL